MVLILSFVRLFILSYFPLFLSLYSFLSLFLPSHRRRRSIHHLQPSLSGPRMGHSWATAGSVDTKSSALDAPFPQVAAAKTATKTQELDLLLLLLLTSLQNMPL